MPISSYVLRCRKEHQFELLGRLCAMSGVTAGEFRDGGIPVAAETSTDAEARAMGERLESLPGVHGAVLVYHNFEDLEPEPNDRHEDQSS